MSNKKTRKYESGSRSKPESSFDDNSNNLTENGKNSVISNSQFADKSRLFDVMLSNISDFTYAFDRRGRFLYVNKSLLDLWGLEQKDALGKDFFGLNYPVELAAKLQNQIERVFTDGKRIKDETAYVSPQGVDGFYEYIFSPVFAPDGSVEFVAGTTRDITERREIEKALRHNEEVYRNLFNSIDEGFCIIEVLFDENNKAIDYLFIETNPAFEGQTGLEKVEGRRILEIAPNHEKFWFEIYGKIALTGQPERFEHQAAALNRWFDLYGFRIGEPEERKVAVLFNDISRRKSDEEKIEKLNERTREILESITDGFFAVDRNWYFTYVNNQAGHILDKDPNELVGKLLWEVYPGLVGSEFEKVYRRAAEEGISLSITSYYPDHDRWYEVNVYPSSNGLTIYFRNATERLRTEEILRESEERFRNMADYAPVMIWITEADGTCVYLSQSWYEFTGQTPEIGLGFGWLEATHPDDQEKSEEVFLAANENNSPFQLEYRLRRKNGEYCWAIDSARPRFDGSGKFLGYIGSVIDITERKQIEEELKFIQAETERQRRFYNTILSSSPDLVYVFDLNHRFSYANKVLLQMWGKTWDEAIGKNCLELGYEPWHAEMHDREIEQVVATKQPIRGEVPFNGTFGRRIYDYIFVPIFGENGEVEAVAGTTRDVTERKEMEEALREADRRKDEFLATLAHELRNPLAPIRSGLEVIRRSASDRETFSKTLDIIERQTNQIVHLVDDLLDISRITHGKIKLRIERIELKKAIEVALEASREIIDESENDLTVTFPHKPIFIDADLTRIAQIFLNILNNAAKYSNAGGKISLVATRTETETVVRIKDTGIGIPQNLISKIFDMFGQVEAQEKAHGGLGIGLSVVKKLVEMHGGTIEAVSEGTGKGSEFIVKLPLSADQVQKNQSSRKEIFQAARSKQRDIQKRSNATSSDQQKVLVVDDNRDAAKMLETLLTLEGYAVQTAFDGKSAIEIAKDFQPEICLLDIGLPEMNGFELAVHLKHFLADALMISVSGWGQEEDRQRSKQAGFAHHLVKPVEIEELLEAISLYSR